MTFTYNTGIPAAGNNPSVDQPNMQTNTNSISSLIAVDHIGFNTANGGYHNVVHLTTQGSDPSVPSGTGSLYAKTVSSIPQLFYRSTAGVVTQLTYNVTPSFATNNGYTVLPSGLIIQWGSANVGSPNRTITFGLTFPNQILNVQATGINSGSSTHTDCVSAQSVSTSGFVCVYSGGSAFSSFYWMAIGF